MRELKFRAKALGGGLVYFNLHELNGPVYESDGVFYVHGLPCKIGSEEQFTGLHDRNGNEIYEGDILNHDNNYEPYKCVMEWSDELGSCGCCYDACHSVGFVGRILPGTSYTYSILASEYHRMKVIGNIYFNPELME
ncbi:MAG: YopX family protein [Halobacteriota archaeon]|nr:YopX family protein [Halobacteriota archaeon]